MYINNMVSYNFEEPSDNKPLVKFKYELLCMLRGQNGHQITCVSTTEHTLAQLAVVNGQKVKPSVHFPVPTQQWLSLCCFTC